MGVGRRGSRGRRADGELHQVVAGWGRVRAKCKVHVERLQ